MAKTGKCGRIRSGECDFGECRRFWHYSAWGHVSTIHRNSKTPCEKHAQKENAFSYGFSHNTFKFYTINQHFKFCRGIELCLGNWLFSGNLTFSGNWHFSVNWLFSKFRFFWNWLSWRTDFLGKFPPFLGKFKKWVFKVLILNISFTSAYEENVHSLCVYSDCVYFLSGNHQKSEISSQSRRAGKENKYFKKGIYIPPNFFLHLFFPFLPFFVHFFFEKFVLSQYTPFCAWKKAL